MNDSRTGSNPVLTTHYKKNNMNVDISTESLEKTIVDQEPWFILFQVGKLSAKVTLKNREDLIKVGQLFSELLSEKGIENILDINYEIN